MDKNSGEALSLGNGSYADYNLKELKECLCARGLNVLIYTGPTALPVDEHNCVPAQLTGNKLDLISRLQEYDAKVVDDGSEARDAADSGPTERYCPFSDDELDDDAPSSQPIRLEATYTRLVY